MSTRFVAIASAGALLFALANAPTADAQLLGGSTPLRVPVTGTVTGGGTFSGTLTIQSFAVQGAATVAVAAIAGSVIGGPGGIGQTGMRANIFLPVTVSSALPISARRPAAYGARIVYAQCGSDVHISIGAGSVVNVMGTQVALNPVMLDVGANAGSLIGSLVCQVISLVGNPTMLVSVLNQLLGQLVGLAGGVGGGLL
jgi:hypothetical protein